MASGEEASRARGNAALLSSNSLPSAEEDLEVAVPVQQVANRADSFKYEKHEKQEEHACSLAGKYALMTIAIQVSANRSGGVDSKWRLRDINVAKVRAPVDADIRAKKADRSSTVS